MSQLNWCGLQSSEYSNLPGWLRLSILRCHFQCICNLTLRMTIAHVWIGLPDQYCGYCAEQSFRKAKWLQQSRIQQLKPQLLRNFIQRRHDGSNDEFGDLVNGIHPHSLLVERVIAQKPTLRGQLYLTKWRDLPYSEATWESEEDLKDDMVSSAAMNKHHSQPVMT